MALYGTVPPFLDPEISIDYRDDLGIFWEYNMVFHQPLAGNSGWEIMGLALR